MPCIFPGQPAEYGLLVEIWKASVLATHSFLHPRHLAYLEEQLPKAYLPSVHELWLYGSDKQIAAFCGCNGDSVEMLFVHPAHMGKHIGSQLLNHARKLHGPLHVDVNEQNEKALAFYLKHGFSITGRSELDAQGWPYPILHMRQKEI